ncbi:MAG: efflux RND transporter periplasmic adaptor subunit [Alphaproteobacteria bacterium]|nr:efflux RND transporter periplasmic adaptor subunit [Alphaproteobacteria bacterium]
MNKLKIKNLLLTGVAILALSGGVIGWNYIVSPTQAAEGHGDSHGHEEGEEKHDEGKEEQHGHGHEEAKDDGHGHGGEEGEHAEGVIALTSEQITAAGIKVAAAGPGKLAREVSVPGKIVAAADRMAQIVPKVGGTVTEAKKNLGDTVEKGEVLALIESREMAESVADYLAAKRAEELARTTFNREKGLWDKKITAEQDYLTAKNAHQEAKIKLDLFKQKLQALGQDGEISNNGNSRFHELRSPLPGRVIARELTLGDYVDTTHSAYTVADLSIVWVETAIAPGDLPFIKEGQTASVMGSGGKATGKLVFVSPAIDPETRAAKAIIELENADGKWRPGEFANAAIATSAQDTDLIVPKDAVQTIEGKPVVFVRNDKGFERRDVMTGREDSQHIEIVSGVAFGEPVAVSSTFTLKAELGKSEAAHEH